MRAGPDRGPASGRGGSSRLSIGAVLARLREEFPDVTVSKIRFLESEGLVTPERTTSGYRSFDTDDVERLRYVLAAQRDRFWPLRVIREALDAMDRGLDPDAVVPGAPAGRAGPSAPRAPVPGGGAPPPAGLLARTPMRLTTAELARSEGVDAEVIQALVAYGLVHADEDGFFGAESLDVARAASVLVGRGIEVRHLRQFRTAADREVGLAEHVLAPLRGRRAARAGEGGDGSAAPVESPADVAAEVAHWCLTLHTALVRDALHRLVGTDDG